MNPSNSCRTCLVLIEQDHVEITDAMFEILENILQINELPRKHDTVIIPQKICFTCFQLLMQIKRFQAQCKDAEEYLKTRLQHALKNDEVVTVEIAHSSTPELSPNNSKSPDQLHEQAADDSFNTEEQYVDDGPENAIAFEMEEFVGVEGEEPVQDGADHLEVLSEHFNEESTLIVEYRNDVYTNDEYDDTSENDERLNEFVKFENAEEEFVDEIDSIEIILGDIDSEGSRDATKIRERKRKMSNSTSHANETIRKKYTCEICEKSFNSKSSLRSHEYIHSDARPYICEICGKAFRQSNILVTHMALHTGKKIECNLCGKKFARKSQLILHDRMHNDEKPFVCDYPKCNAAFRQNQYLIAHKETHTGIRRYQCTVCSRAFFNKPSLLGHLHRVHGNVFYQCDMCERHCKKPQQMRNHMKSVHQIELTDVTHLKQRKQNNFDNSENSTEL